MHKSDLQTTIIKKEGVLEDGSRITFFLHDIQFPENVHATPQRKSFVVAIDSNRPASEISARIATRPNTIFVAIPDPNIKEGKIIFEDWEKENPDRDDKPNPFTLTSVELDQLEFKIKTI